MDTTPLEESLLQQLESRPVRTDLAPVTSALESLDVEPPDHVVQVVGSNGKGSVVHYLSEAIRSSRMPVVSYTSPHFEHPRERLRVNGEAVEPQRFQALLKNVDEQVTEDLSAFEILVVASVILSGESGAYCLVLEAGMGGRWDATSAVPADVTVLTSVEREHTRFLGSTIEEIAREMTAQIPDGSRLINPNFDDPVRSVLEQRIQGRNLTHHEINRSDRSIPDLLRKISAETAGLILGKQAAPIRRQLNDVPAPPGRGQVVAFEGRRCVLDVAHTPDAVDVLTREHIPGDVEPWAIFGCLENKDAETMIETLQRRVSGDRLFAVQPPTSRGRAPETYVAGTNTIQVQPGPGEAWRAISDRGDPTDWIIITGSFAMIRWFRDRFGEELR